MDKIDIFTIRVGDIKTSTKEQIRKADKKVSKDKGSRLIDVA